MNIKQKKEKHKHAQKLEIIFLFFQELPFIINRYCFSDNKYSPAAVLFSFQKNKLAVQCRIFT